MCAFCVATCTEQGPEGIMEQFVVQWYPTSSQRLRAASTSRQRYNSHCIRVADAVSSAEAIAAASEARAGRLQIQPTLAANSDKSISSQLVVN